MPLPSPKAEVFLTDMFIVDVDFRDLIPGPGPGPGLLARHPLAYVSCQTVKTKSPSTAASCHARLFLPFPRLA